MTDWKARAEREASAIVDELGVPWGLPLSREHVVSMLAIAWLQGTDFGTHSTLHEVAQAFEKARAEL